MRALLRAGLPIPLILGGIAYSSWVLEFFIETGLDPRNTFLSELDAVGQRYRDVFSVADSVTGSLMILAALAALIVLPRRPFTTTGWIALAVFGAATIADSQLPIGCIATPEHPCSSEPSGLFPQLHHIHALTSTIAVNAIFVAMIAFTVAAFRYRMFRVLRIVGLLLFIIASMTTAWMLIADNLDGDYSLGYAQRGQVGAMSLWIVTLGVAVLVGIRSPSRTDS